jgi:hypothetical protein
MNDNFLLPIGWALSIDGALRRDDHPRRALPSGSIDCGWAMPYAAGAYDVHITSGGSRMIEPDAQAAAS